jgi:hypothetical protein
MLPPGFKREVVLNHWAIDSFKGTAEEKLWHWGENSHPYVHSLYPQGKYLVSMFFGGYSDSPSRSGCCDEDLPLQLIAPYPFNYLKLFWVLYWRLETVKLRWLINFTLLLLAYKCLSYYSSVFTATSTGTSHVAPVSIITFRVAPWHTDYIAGVHSSLKILWQ